MAKFQLSAICQVVLAPSSAGGCLPSHRPVFGIVSLGPTSELYQGQKKGPQRTFATKISPNFRVNFLARFASKPLFIVCSALDFFRKFFGAVLAILWLWGSFWPLTVALSGSGGLGPPIALYPIASRYRIVFQKNARF